MKLIPFHLIITLSIISITSFKVSAVSNHQNLVFVRNNVKGKVSDTSLVNNTTTKIKCYHFSWLGPKTPSTSSEDFNLSCDEDFKNEEPCFEPLVYTIGNDKENGPNTTAIEEICESTGECNPLCEIAGSDMCIKLVYYKSSDGGVDSSHSFCGTVKGVLPIEGCHYQKMKDGKDVQACFCSTDRCNGSQRLSISSFICIPLVFLALLNPFLINMIR